MTLDFQGKCLYPPADNATLKEKLHALGVGLEDMTNTAEGHDIPTGDFRLAAEVIKLIPELFSKIAHGESGHRQWLEEAIENHFTGKPMPEYKAK
ncbi:hypothetical protein D3C79_47810 [compost metagenome]